VTAQDLDLILRADTGHSLTIQCDAYAITDAELLDAAAGSSKSMITSRASPPHDDVFRANRRRIWIER
jgi:hypothetical protein